MTEYGKRQLLAALKARLELDADLGVDFVHGGLVDFSDIATEFHRAASRPERHAEPAEEAAQAYEDIPPEIPRRIPAVDRPPAGAAPTAPTRAAGSAFVSLVPLRAGKPNPGKEALLVPFRDEASACRKCELCERRTTVVWGEGSLDARVMFIGEGPGREEDEQGRPFVGRSGRVLTDIIEKGMGVARNEVYIANVVKCRPPGNRDPKPHEVAACSAYLAKQMDVIKPEVIVAVGGVAGCALLGLPPRSPGLRNKWHEFNSVPLRVIYHPSYLLRQRRGPDDRTQADMETWKDIKEVMARLR